MGIREQERAREQRAARRRRAESTRRERLGTTLPGLIERHLNDLKRQAVTHGYPCNADEALDPLTDTELGELRVLLCE